MFSLIAGGIAFLVAVVLPIYGFITNKITYGSELENYIVSRNPKDAGDVERLTMEYSNKLQRNRIL
jgi:hypothetical protein